MATELRGFDIPLLAGADLSSNMYCAVKVHTTLRQVVVCTAVGDDAVGILLNDPSAAGQPATVRTHGLVKMVASAAIAVGDRVSPTTGGKAVKTTVSDTNPICILGKAITAVSNANEIVTVALNIVWSPNSSAIS
jgi:hypothetical protein